MALLERVHLALRSTRAPQLLSRASIREPGNSFSPELETFPDRSILPARAVVTLFQ